MGDGGTATYDNGFYDIGVRPAFEDLGVGGADRFGNPLSFARAAGPGGSRVAVDGAFKVPSLRNVALTPPYFHDGGRRAWPTWSRSTAAAATGAPWRAATRPAPARSAGRTRRRRSAPAWAAATSTRTSGTRRSRTAAWA